MALAVSQLWWLPLEQMEEEEPVRAPGLMPYNIRLKLWQHRVLLIVLAILLQAVTDTYTHLAHIIAASC